MGRALLPRALLRDGRLAAQALLASGDKPRPARVYLPGIAAGRTTAAARRRRGRRFLGPRPDLRTGRDADGDGGWRLSGRKSFVIDGTTADLILVVARTVGGPSFFAVDGTPPA